MKKEIVRIISIVGIILLIPLVFSAFPDSGWDWGIVDFIIIGLLLFCTGLGLVITKRIVTRPLYRYTMYVIIICILLAIWAELAVDALSQLVK